MKAVILAGGKGARLAPYTHILPKPLMPIGDMPIMELLLWQMKRAGVDDIILTVGHLSELLRTFFKNGEKWGVNISYSYEDTPLGTAGPLSLIEGLDDTFLVTNGDVMTTLDLHKLLAFHKDQGGVATIAVHERQVKINLGVVKMDGGNTISGYVEKPTYDYTVSMGIYVFEPQVLQHIPHNEYLDFPDLVLKLIAAGEKVVAYPFNGYWKDLGYADDYGRATQDFQKMRSQFLPEEYK